MSSVSFTDEERIQRLWTLANCIAFGFGGIGSYSRDGSVIAGCPRIFKILHHNWNINRTKRSADDPSVDSEKIVYYSRQRSIKWHGVVEFMFPSKGKFWFTRFLLKLSDGSGKSAKTAISGAAKALRYLGKDRYGVSKCCETEARSLM